MSVAGERRRSAEAIVARLTETSPQRTVRELSELGRAPVWETPQHLRAFEACEEFARTWALRGVETTQAERDEYLATYEAVTEGT